MAQAISVRLDDDAARALRALEATGMSRSEAIRNALIHPARHGDTTRGLVEQVAAVDVSRLGDLHGHLSREELWGVDDALVTVLGLR